MWATKEYIEKAQYRCQDCGHVWVQRAGPTLCPRCGCIMVEWLNHPLNREALG